MSISSDCSVHFHNIGSTVSNVSVYECNTVTQPSSRRIGTLGYGMVEGLETVYPLENHPSLQVEPPSIIRTRTLSTTTLPIRCYYPLNPPVTLIRRVYQYFEPRCKWISLIRYVF